MYRGGNDRVRQDSYRVRPDPREKDELIEMARKFITGENMIDPESLLGYDGTVRKFVEPKSNSNRNDTKSHQLRKFYSDIVDIWGLAEKFSGDQNDADVSKLKIRLAMMEARLNYARERGVLSRDTFELLTACVSTVNRQKDNKWVESLERFRTFFEALVAYSYKGK